MQVWQEISQQVAARFDCEHTQTEVRFKVTSAGLRQYWQQCLRCGRNRGAVRKANIVDAQRTKQYDEELEKSWWKEQSEYRQLLYAQKQDTDRRQWFSEHDAYLRSPEWRARRQSVLRRDSFKCQARLPGCDGEATQVHHLTYTHWQEEPLFDLVSICDACHERVTQMDRQRRGVA